MCPLIDLLSSRRSVTDTGCLRRVLLCVNPQFLLCVPRQTRASIMWGVAPLQPGVLSDGFDELPLSVPFTADLVDAGLEEEEDEEEAVQLGLSDASACLSRRRFTTEPDELVGNTPGTRWRAAWKNVVQQVLSDHTKWTAARTELSRLRKLNSIAGTFTDSPP